jgi:hexosaminidase
VTLIPEIEAPGHALVISQWKPELGLDDLSMLNISYPETIPNMRSIWNTFLPWFQSKVVHIGADEYDPSLVGEYTRFVNLLNQFIGQKSGKSVRIWGTFTPQEGANVSTDVSIQHWTMGADNPYFDYIQRGYEVLNSADAFYVVGGWSEGYPQVLNKTTVFHGNPANGGPFAPNIFDIRNASNNPARDNPMILGQAAAFWNDNGPNATTVIEAYYALRDVLPALGDKQWGGNVTANEYDTIFDDLHTVIPGQNLDQSIPSKSDTILHYRFDAMDKSSSVVRDFSGNGYDGIVRGCQVINSSIHFADGCYLETPLASKGRNYTLSFWVKPTSTKPGTLFDGPESVLMDGNGAISNITLVSGGNPYSLNYSLPRDEWTHVKLVGRGDSTLLAVTNEKSETETMEFLTYFGTLFLVWVPVSVVAPLARIGEGFTGFVRDIVLHASAA